MSERTNVARAPGRLLAIIGTTLAMALALPAARAQETGGAIFGWGPAGRIVTVKGVSSGARRHATINDSGRYTIGRLPLGVYTVTLEKDGKPVDTRSNVTLKVGRGAEVDFACPDDQCAAPEGGR